MKKLILLVVPIIICLVLIPHCFAKTPTTIMENFGKAVVLIGSVNDNGELVGLGSGFFVTNKGVLITNFHVIKDAYSVMVKLTNGDVYDEIFIIDTDERRDIAVLKINGFELPTVQLGNSNTIKVGEKIVVIGNPQGLENSISDGLLSAVRKSGVGHKMFQMTAPISLGSSGSPVFSMNGKVVGIATSSLVDGQNLNFCIPINYVRGMISEAPKMKLAKFTDKIKQKTLISVDMQRIKKQAEEFSAKAKDTLALIEATFLSIGGGINYKDYDRLMQNIIIAYSMLKNESALLAEENIYLSRVYDRLARTVELLSNAKALWYKKISGDRTITMDMLHDQWGFAEASFVSAKSILDSARSGKWISYLDISGSLGSMKTLGGFANLSIGSHWDKVKKVIGYPDYIYKGEKENEIVWVYFMGSTEFTFLDEYLSKIEMCCISWTMNLDSVEQELTGAILDSPYCIVHDPPIFIGSPIATSVEQLKSLLDMGEPNREYSGEDYGRKTTELIFIDKEGVSKQFTFLRKEDKLIRIMIYK